MALAAIVERGRTVVAGALDEIRERYQRVQLVFAGDAPVTPLRSPGVVRVTREGRMLTVLTRDREALMTDVRALAPASIDWSPVTLKEIFLESVRTED